MERERFHDFRKLSHNTTTASGKFFISESGMRIPELNQPNGTTNCGNEECTVREQDRFMPIANVIRIMRRILPAHAKISDDAKETIQECVSEYISFITGEANERCQREQRKTITAEDVLWAMSKLGFDDYIEPLTLYLHRFRELEGERGSSCGGGGGSSGGSVTMNGSLVVKRSNGAYGPGFHVPHYHFRHHSSGLAFGGYEANPKMGETSSAPNGATGVDVMPYEQHHKF